MGPTLFLPGAAGRASFWAPVAERLQLEGGGILPGWPGFGDEPLDPAVRGIEDLARFALARLEGVPEFNIVAQSMGGVVAMLTALSEPGRVKRLVLCGTSGGVDFGEIVREDWRPDYLNDLPELAPRWFSDDRSDLTSRLHQIKMPVLLIWGAEDRIAPPAAGRLLAGLLPDARLVVVPGAGHAVAQERPDEVAAHIAAFLGQPASPPPGTH